MRPVARLRAWVGGYFWAACPVCGRCFGGHEQRSGTLVVASGAGKITCPRCPGEWVAWRGSIWRPGVLLTDDSDAPEVMLILHHVRPV